MPEIQSVASQNRQEQLSHRIIMVDDCRAFLYLLALLATCEMLEGVENFADPCGSNFRLFCYVPEKAP